MENLNLAQNINAKNSEQVLFMLLKEGVKNNISEIVMGITSIEDLDNILYENSIDNLFTNIRDTIIQNIQIAKSVVDGNEYFVNSKDNIIIENGFSEIVEVVENNGKIVFQARDYDIDGLYAYYDYDTGEVISKKSDRRIYGFLKN